MFEKIMKAPNRPALVIALALFAMAAVTYWDASRMAARATYGMNASAASYFVCLFFAVLGLGHVVSAFQAASIEVEDIDMKAIGWVGLALAGLIGSIWLGAGFILGSTLLFAFTARAFGRRAFLVDLVIGALMGLVIFLLFNKLLSLALPQGPLERVLF
ncbi:MAG TPA: tripartite tricarboxylate transporter TctB family protein [Ensifer sp.]|jgi:putative tricarboxylic transport membrane protein|uniref:tripartite tricarboxylate transporter TctB family protein n=1 Tax=Ensifer sp. TaxID=1872086 RepID=UPI002E11D725|nr:tripartite tricarboxylate transporter TctB family protein [Ensifer sp.]